MKMDLLQIEEELKNILHKQRLNNDNCIKFKNLLCCHSLGLSKEFFLNGIYNNKQRNRLNTRLNRISKNAEIPINIGYGYFERLTSKKGILYKEKYRKAFHFFKVKNE